MCSSDLVWGLTMLHYLGTGNRGVDVTWFYTAVTIRDVAVVALMVLVVRNIWLPDTDRVRLGWPGTDDPAGGVLDGAVDEVTLRTWRRAASHRGQEPSPAERSR